MTTLDRVRQILDTHSIPYALIGAAALASYGVARSTFDIDLLTTSARVLDEDLWSGLAADVRRGDQDDPLAGVVRTSGEDDQPVDIVVGKHAWQSRAVERALRLGDSTPVVQPRDLILLKLYAGGAQDLWDIRELLKHVDAAIASEVDADLDALPRALRGRWNRLRETDEEKGESEDSP